MITGLDQFPASRRFINAVEEVPDDEFVSCIGDVSHVTTNHAVAHHDIWSRIMAPTPTDFTELIEWAWAKGLNIDGHRDANQQAIAIGWGTDEVLFAHLIKQCEGLKLRTIFKDCWPDWLNRVLGITQIVPDPKKLAEGYYSELHIRLPLSDQDRSTFNALLATDALMNPKP